MNLPAAMRAAQAGANERQLSPTEAKASARLIFECTGALKFSSTLSGSAEKRRERRVPLHSRPFAPACALPADRSIRGCHITTLELTGLATQPYGLTEHDSGEKPVTSLWVTEQKLTNGVEIAAELWSLMVQQPGSTAMIVVGDDHAPCALTGQELLELKDSRQIALHPARYRLVETNAD